MRRIAAALSLLTLVACTGEPAEDAEETVRRAVATTIATGSAHVSLVSRLNDARLVGEGATTFSTGNGTMRLSVHSGPTLRDIRMQALLADGVFYDRYTRQPDSAPPWVKHQGPSAVRVRARQFEVLGTLDVRAALRHLEAVTGAERGGTEDVRGVRTRLYRGTLDLSRAAGAEDALFRYGTPYVTFAAWIDGQGRVARFMLDVDADRLIGSSTRGTLTTTFELYDLGGAPPVTAPPPGQVSLTT